MRNTSRQPPSHITHGAAALFILLYSASAQAAPSHPPTLREAAPAGFADVVAKAMPAVVRITTSFMSAAEPGSEEAHSTDASARPRRRSGEGSGFIVSPDGNIVTSHHVVADADRIVVLLGDERELPARIVAADSQTDIAVLKVEATNLPTVTFASSATVRPGDYALAIGNPFGIGTTVTLGIVSAAAAGGRSDHAGFEDFIQTDAAINPGNSGGPLLNLQGQVIGMNTAILSPSGASSGVGFALPSNLVQAVVTQLTATGKVRRGYLGVGLQPMTPQLAEALEVPAAGGALIADVTPASPAELAGLAKGDVIVSLNGHALRDTHRLRLYVAEAKPDAAIDVVYRRDGKEIRTRVQLIEKPDSPAGSQNESERLKPAESALAGGTSSESSPRLLSEAKLSESPNGVAVDSLDAAGLSAGAGLQSGDLIVAVSKKPVKTLEQLRELLSAGDKEVVLLEVSRAGSTYFLAIPRS